MQEKNVKGLVQISIKRFSANQNKEVQSESFLIYVMNIWIFPI